MVYPAKTKNKLINPEKGLVIKVPNKEPKNKQQGVCSSISGNHHHINYSLFKSVNYLFKLKTQVLSIKQLLVKSKALKPRVQMIKQNISMHKDSNRQIVVFTTRGVRKINV